MKNGERRLHEFIWGVMALDDAPDEDARRKVVEEFDYQRKKMMVRMTLWIFVCLAFIYCGAWWIATAGETREMLFGFFLMMIGLESSVLIKLWYWVVDSRMATSKEIKQVQLQLSQIAARLEAMMPTADDREGGTDHVDA